jgi:hypothetical protein
MRKSIWMGIIAGALLHLCGCTTIKSNTVCPAGTIGTSWSSKDSNIVGSLIAAGLSAASAAGFMDKIPSNPPQTTVSVSSTYPWGFGSNSGATGCIIPTAVPATTTINNNQGGVLNMQAPTLR